MEYGLTNAYWAVKRHLPRSDNDPTKIRTGAKLAIIFATDEVPHELKEDGSFNGQMGFLNDSDCRSTQCRLDDEKQIKLNEFLAPLFDLFGGTLDPDAKAIVQVIAGTCDNSCSAEVAHGYRDLANAFGGQVGDVCQEDLGATLNVIVDSIVGAAAPRILAHTPISSTLQVAIDGQRLKRSHPGNTNTDAAGYFFNPTNNSISLINVESRIGLTIVASYRRFDDAKRDLYPENP